MNAYISATLLSLSLCACAGPVTSLAGYGYTSVNTATAIATDKGLTDRAVSRVTDADCNVWNLAKGLYYCELRDVSRTYNRNGF